ncbi:THO complex subunit 5B [Cardamine amara subsp. amara]|uniref:THO complex subunit 5B n=1 Tax=Cardamine amara subsp. amara TaxID=228776 RepID=A0ABD0ZVU0_CARAN
MEDGEIEEGMITADEFPTSEVTTETIPQPREPAKSPLELLRESKTSVEEIVAKMLSIKKEGNNKSEIRELLTQMFLNFVNLRQANRAILTEEDKVKAETERAKAPVDFTTLQLHNLMYEKSHYVKAIKACRDFKSKYPDIELVPEEDFFRDAPEAIKDKLVSSDSSHVLMPKRLNFELLQRKELCKHRVRLEQQKKSLLETIAERKKFLSSLPLHLKALKKASLPVQNQLGIQHTKTLKQHNLAELLPPPLYVIYSQLLAQKEAFEECIDLEIVGSLKDAQAYVRQQTKKDSGMSNNTESSRLEDDGPDDDDDGQRRRKRPKKLTTKGSDKAGLYQAHPLKIFLHIYDDENPDTKSLKLVILKFEYLLKLNVVCVGAEGSQDGPEKNIFCNLFPDDAGLEPPHQSTKLILGDGQAFDENRTSRPYKWVQHLAGIDILPEVSPILLGQETHNIDSAKSDVVVSDLSLYRQQHRVQRILQRIRSRKKAHLALAEQLDLLMKHELPDVKCEDAPWALHKVLCTLDSWLHIQASASMSSSLTLNSMEQVPEPMEIDVDGRSISGKEDLEGIREDGELPSLVTAAASVTSSNHTPLKVSNVARSRQLALMTKNLDSPISKGKSPSFKKYEDDLDLVLDDDSEVDEPAGTTEAHVEALYPEKTDNSWVDYGTREFALVFSRKTDGGKLCKLEATVQISMEYPLRPPFFSLSLHASSASGNENGTNESDHYNELRAMEAEVNLHMLKIVPSDQENYLLSHQIRCLAMLFDYYVDDPSPDSKRGTATTVVDVGLCKPVDGKLLVRSFRGRDHRKMISWKDRGCASGYPC